MHGFCAVVTGGEWEFVATYTTRQDGRAAWLVSLTQCDDVVSTRAGLDDAGRVHDALNKAIADLTREAGWIQPVNDHL